MHYWAFISRDFALNDAEITAQQIAGALKAFNEDRDALEWIEELDTKEGRHSRLTEASFSSDRGSLAMRKIIKQLAEAEAR